MKVVIVPNALKDCLTTSEAADAIEKGILNAFPKAETVKVPVADGGDGLLDALLAPLNGVCHTVEVTGPRYDKIRADFAYFPEQKTAIIEMAKASGLALLPLNERDAEQTTSLGTGELIKAALSLDVTHILVGIGGSATCDGGIGLAEALGIRFLDKNGAPVKPIGKSLQKIAKIDLSNKHPKLSAVKIEVVCDVDNPLLGKSGAAYVYGPQKGASPEQVKELDSGLANLAAIIKKDLGVDVTEVVGGGAAGGIGAGMYAYFNAPLKSGIDIVLDLVKLREKLKNADLVLTAEGQMDNQTAFGKAPAGVAKCAKEKNIPCIAIAGGVKEDIDELYKIGINAVFSLCPAPITLEDAIQNGASYLSRISEQIIRAYFVNR
jgi:glycerate 2-kinase